jgi:hypothetical protein
MDAEEFWDRLFAMDVSAMTENERLYYAVNAFLCEWANGSLSQYFHNTGGEELGILGQGLAAIGADEAGVIMNEATQVLFDGAERCWQNLPWPVPDSKQDQLEALNRRIAAVENEISDRLEAFAISQGLFGAGTN